MKIYSPARVSPNLFQSRNPAVETPLGTIRSPTTNTSTATRTKDICICILTTTTTTTTTDPKSFTTIHQLQHKKPPQQQFSVHHTRCPHNLISSNILQAMGSFYTAASCFCHQHIGRHRRTYTPPNFRNFPSLSLQLFFF